MTLLHPIRYLDAEQVEKTLQSGEGPGGELKPGRLPVRVRLGQDVTGVIETVEPTCQRVGVLGDVVRCSQIDAPIYHRGKVEQFEDQLTLDIARRSDDRTR